MGANDSFSMIPFSDEHRMLREMLRKYCDEKVAPRAIELDQEKKFPHEAIKELAELDLLGIYIPEEYGGAGMDFVSYAITIEELARVCAWRRSRCWAPRNRK
jgi:alkylation response protein AidB-like acyl-CoA dehydrogenase